MPTERSQSRRTFIQQALLASGRCVGPASGGASLNTAVPGSGASVDRLRTKLRGSVIVPQDAEYAAARRIFFWHPTTEPLPALIVRCANDDDVRRALDFARTDGLEVAVRGGGHSPMGWGICEGLVIDLARMNEVRSIARVESRVCRPARQVER